MNLSDITVLNTTDNTRSTFAIDFRDHRQGILVPAVDLIWRKSGSDGIIDQ